MTDERTRALSEEAEYGLTWTEDGPLWPPHYPGDYGHRSWCPDCKEEKNDETPTTMAQGARDSRDSTTRHRPSRQASRTNSRRGTAMAGPGTRPRGRRGNTKHCEGYDGT